MIMACFWDDYGPEAFSPEDICYTKRKLPTLSGAPSSNHLEALSLETKTQHSSATTHRAREFGASPNERVLY